MSHDLCSTVPWRCRIAFLPLQIDTVCVCTCEKVLWHCRIFFSSRHKLHMQVLIRFCTFISWKSHADREVLCAQTSASSEMPAVMCAERQKMNLHMHVCVHCNACFRET